MILILKLIILWHVCGFIAVIALLWMFLSVIGGSPRAWKIAIAFDQLANAAFGGDEDETISARCWRLREGPLHSALVMMINLLANDPKHCEDSYLDEQQRRQRYG